jgi:hypothetical protein
VLNESYGLIGGNGGSLGGAIFNDSGIVEIRNSTFIRNTAYGRVYGYSFPGGGAIFSRNGSLTVVDSTFSHNCTDENLCRSDGGAITVVGESPANFLLYNTIVSGNFVPDSIVPNGAECLLLGNVVVPTGRLPSVGNLITHSDPDLQHGPAFAATKAGLAVTTCSGITTTTDPQLGSLRDNGGFTPTMAIPFGSVAMSAADPASSLSTDQRGQARPQANGYDVGAFEVCRRALAGGLIEPMFCSETTFAGFPTASLTIMSSTPSGGTVTPAPGTYSVPQNTVEVLSATPAPGYYFKNWTGNVAQPTGLTTTIIIGAQAQTVSANFQLHDFSLSANPTSFTLPLGGATATIDVSASALGDFGDEITLTATGHPSGMAASLNANTLTPLAGTPAMSTLTIAVGPSAIPQSFTETITGNSTGLSGALSHSAQVKVTFVITPDALVKIINQDLSLGCIASAGFAQSLIAKAKTYQTLAGGGYVQGATNVLAAFQYEVQAQIGHQIVSSCTDPVGGNAFSPGQVLIADAQALQAMLGGAAKAAPIVGFVTSANDAGTAGMTVDLISGKSAIETATTDGFGFYYFDTTALKVGAQYAATVTIPKGYKASSPASQTFTWTARALQLATFTLN